ncbi:hypothetical protein GJ496_009535 [Pomphorhynchus laevis]|nr:hypothetical protein GJ496_009535 [Pomphorhynchus laevis]
MERLRLDDGFENQSGRRQVTVQQPVCQTDKRGECLTCLVVFSITSKGVLCKHGTGMSCQGAGQPPYVFNWGGASVQQSHKTVQKSVSRRFISSSDDESANALPKYVLQRPKRNKKAISTASKLKISVRSPSLSTTRQLTSDEGEKSHGKNSECSFSNNEKKGICKQVLETISRTRSIDSEMENFQTRLNHNSHSIPSSKSRASQLSKNLSRYVNSSDCARALSTVSNIQSIDSDSEKTLQVVEDDEHITKSSKLKLSELPQDSKTDRSHQPNTNKLLSSYINVLKSLRSDSLCENHLPHSQKPKIASNHMKSNIKVTRRTYPGKMKGIKAKNGEKQVSALSKQNKNTDSNKINKPLASCSMTLRQRNNLNQVCVEYRPVIANEGTPLECIVYERAICRDRRPLENRDERLISKWFSAEDMPKINKERGKVKTITNKHGSPIGIYLEDVMDVPRFLDVDPSIKVYRLQIHRAIPTIELIDCKLLVECYWGKVDVIMKSNDNTEFESLNEEDLLYINPGRHVTIENNSLTTKAVVSIKRLALDDDTDDEVDTNLSSSQT